MNGYASATLIALSLVGSGCGSDTQVQDALPPADAAEVARDTASVVAVDAAQEMSDAPLDGASPEAGVADARDPDGEAVGGDTGPRATCSEFELMRGSARVVDMYGLATGFVVVTTQAVTLYHRDGTIVTSVPSPREILTSTWDGAQLVVGDRAIATVYDANLAKKNSFTLVSTCFASTPLGGTRWLCRHSYSAQDPTLRVYDTSTGATVGTGAVHGYPTYDGIPIPMTTIPGTTIFAVEGRLYRFLDDGMQKLVASLSLDNGSYAFFKRPATILLDRSGRALRLFGPACAQPTDPGADCFVQETSPPIVQAQESGLAVADDELNAYMATRAYSGTFPSRTDPCTDNCNLKQIDFETRMVTAQKSYGRRGALIQSIVHDRMCKKLLVSFRLNGYAPDYTPSYGVDLAAYQ